ncbi:hypothetical protein EFS38_12395 [Dickeya undicola]|uniref:Uncharacterized protein n=1 Tax=Dickeya undicola TaxID=1577887 RepID=A0ABX9WX67_9GAMM|nr:hypothetical protein EFS38_12395 [Dickeya undicola]
MGKKGMRIFIRMVFILCFFIFYSFNVSAYALSFVDFKSNQSIEAIVKNVPKISKKYQIKHGDAEGPGKQVTGVYFENTTDINTLRNYVKSLGFIIKIDDGYREVWESPDKSKFIILSVNREDNATYFEVLL